MFVSSCSGVPTVSTCLRNILEVRFSSGLVRGNLCRDTTHRPDDACLNQKASPWILSKALNLTPEECKVSLLQGFGPKENGRGVWMICSNFWVTLGRYLGEIIMVSFGIWPIPGNKALSTRRCFKLKWSTQSAESLTMLQWLAMNHLLSSYASCTDAWNTSYRWWFQSCFLKPLLAEMFQFDWSFEMAWSLQPDGASNSLFTVMILGI